MIQSLWNWIGRPTVVLLICLSNFKAIVEVRQSPGFEISRNLRIRLLNRLLNKASAERVVMLMKTKLWSDMKIFFGFIQSDVAFKIVKQGSLNTDYSYSSVSWINIICSYFYLLRLKDCGRAALFCDFRKTPKLNVIWTTVLWIWKHWQVHWLIRQCAI